MKNTYSFSPAIFLVIMILQGFSGNALAGDPKAEPERYVVVGQGTMFALHEPSGWKMDTNSEKNEGLPVVFYPSGQTWKSARAVIYANTALNDCHTSFDSFVAKDEASSRMDSRGITSAKITEMTVDNIRVVIKSYSGDRYGNTEAVAYFDNAGGSFITLVLSAKASGLYSETYPLFKELVSSFQLVGNTTSCTAPKAKH